MSRSLNMMIGIGAAAGLGYFCLREYRAWWDVTDQFMAEIGEIRDLCRSLDDKATRLEKQLAGLSGKLEQNNRVGRTTNTTAPKPAAAPRARAPRKPKGGSDG